MSKKSNKNVHVDQKFNRNFSEAFKRAKVEELKKGTTTILALCRLHQISRSAVYKWIYLYSNTVKGTKTVVQMDSEQERTLQLERRVAELERIIGQKQLDIDFLNKSFELASVEAGFDLKKKYGPIALNGSGKTPTDTTTK